MSDIMIFFTVGAFAAIILNLFKVYCLHKQIKREKLEFEARKQE